MKINRLFITGTGDMEGRTIAQVAVKQVNQVFGKIFELGGYKTNLS